MSYEQNHIESRLRTLKREFQILHDMLTGPNTRGFGWDNVRKCVTAKNDVWDGYVHVRVHYIVYYYTLSFLTFHIIYSTSCFA